MVKARRAYRCILTLREPSSRLKHSSITTSSSFPSMSEILPAIHLWHLDQHHSRDLAIVGHLYFFMTSTLTFCMSTFWLNSAGNLVNLSSLASTLEAMESDTTAIVRWILNEIETKVGPWTLDSENISIFMSRDYGPSPANKA